MDCGALGGDRRYLGMVSPALLQTNLGARGSLCSCRAAVMSWGSHCHVTELGEFWESAQVRNQSAGFI